MMGLLVLATIKVPQQLSYLVPVVSWPWRDAETGGRWQPLLEAPPTQTIGPTHLNEVASITLQSPPRPNITRVAGRSRSMMTDAPAGRLAGPCAVVRPVVSWRTSRTAPF